MIIILRFWGFVALLLGDLHLFARLFVIGWENNKDCDITMPLSLKTMEVNEVNNVTGKGSFNIRNWDVLNRPFDKPRNFANIWYIKWNQMKSLKFETVQIHFLSDVFGFLSFRNLLSWQPDDFSSLLVFLPVMCSVLIWPVPLHDLDSVSWSNTFDLNWI